MDYAAEAKALPWGKDARILSVDANGLLAVEKPAGLLSHPNRKGEQGKSLLRAAYDLDAQAYFVKSEGEEEEPVYLLNRLDSGTSGIVLLTLSSKVAAAVLLAFEKKAVRKIYSAVVFGAPPRGRALWKDRLSVKKELGGVRAHTGEGSSAETRLLEAKQLSAMPTTSLLKLAPLTGRTHQLRIQAAKRKCPIVGDRTYGNFRLNKTFGSATGIKRLCLHCVETSLEYALGGKVWAFAAKSKDPFAGLIKKRGS